MSQMHKVTIRFSEHSWGLITAYAEERGMSAAEFVRETAVARLAYEEGLAAGRREAGVSAAESVLTPPA